MLIINQNKSCYKGERMNKDICISVQGIQNTGSGWETILTKTTGTYYFENGFHVVNYHELDEHGTDTDNILFLSETEMRLCKSGSLSGQFLFLQGEKTLAEYFTPFGEMNFEVETESYKMRAKKKDINAQVIYRLYADGCLFLENNLSVHIEDSGIENIGL